MTSWPSPERSDTLDWLLAGATRRAVDFSSLPGEHELRNLLGSSRASIREVLRNLARWTVVERKRSAGTFSRQPFERKAIGRARGEDDIPQEVQYRLLARERTSASPLHRRIFGLDQVCLIRVRRLTIVHGRPVGLWSSYVPSELEARLPEGAWESGAQELALHLGGPQTTVHYSLTAVAADGWCASTLDVPPGSPLLHIERTFWADGRPVLIGFGRRPGMRFTAGTSLSVLT